MKHILAIALIALIAMPAAQAVDIKTDASCKKLVAAIDQGQSLEACKVAWQTVIQSSTITAQDRADILQQTIPLAQEYKARLQQELTHLGDETKNYSKIKWGVAQLILGTYLAAGEINGLTSTPSTLNGLLWPESKYIIRKPLSGEMETNKALVICACRILVINPIGAIYCFYKAYHNLTQGLNYKQLLQTNIANLESIISYLQELQTEAAA